MKVLAIIKEEFLMQQLGKRLLNWWSKYSKIIKVVFVTSVLVFVILALGNFFKTVKWHEVGVGLANLSLGKHHPTPNYRMHRSHPYVGV